MYYVVFCCFCFYFIKMVWISTANAYIEYHFFSFFICHWGSPYVWLIVYVSLLVFVTSGEKANKNTDEIMTNGLRAYVRLHITLIKTKLFVFVRKPIRNKRVPTYDRAKSFVAPFSRTKNLSILHKNPLILIHICALLKQ